MKKQPEKITDLIPDDRNANRHTEYGTALMDKGLRQNGFGRSILISNDNKIIAGNGITEAGGAIGLEDVQVVNSDGKKIIAIKRTDIESGTKEFYAMALSDNIISEKNIIMDAEIVEAICEEYEIEDWGTKGLNNTNGKITKENLDPYEMTHILISFPPEKLLYIQSILEQVKNIEDVEYEQSSN